jgi:hypothetical protein
VNSSHIQPWPEEIGFEVLVVVDDHNVADKVAISDPLFVAGPKLVNKVTVDRFKDQLFRNEARSPTKVTGKSIEATAATVSAEPFGLNPIRTILHRDHY